MDWMTVKLKCTDFYKKYRYVLLILLIGIVLMILPKQTKQSTNHLQRTESLPINQDQQEALEEILSQIKGAGRVKVLLTPASGEKTLYQTDSTQSEDESGSSLQASTIIITDENRKESGLITQVNPPVYLGAIVVCDGAADSNVRLSIMDAVSKATGLGADKISILKMK